MIRKAVIPAAGFGTRFLPATKSMPKEMLPVVDKPVIQYVVEEAVAAGITDILMVIGRGKRAIEEHFDRAYELEASLAAKGRDELLNRLRHITDMADIHFVWQKEMNGLGDAVLHGRHHVGDEPFAVLLGDTILEAAPGAPSITAQLVETYTRRGKTTVACEEVARDRVSRYGVLDATATDDPDEVAVRDFVEKPAPEHAPSNLVIASRYVFDPRLFAYLDCADRGVGGEIQLTDAMAAMTREHGAFGRRIAGRRWDIGNALGYIQAGVHFALQRDDLADELRADLRAQLG